MVKRLIPVVETEGGCTSFPLHAHHVLPDGGALKLDSIAKLCAELTGGRLPVPYDTT